MNDDNTIYLGDLLPRKRWLVAAALALVIGGGVAYVVTKDERPVAQTPVVQQPADATSAAASVNEPGTWTEDEAALHLKNYAQVAPLYVPDGPTQKVRRASCAGRGVPATPGRYSSFICQVTLINGEKARMSMARSLYPGSTSLQYVRTGEPETPAAKTKETPTAQTQPEEQPPPDADGFAECLRVYGPFSGPGAVINNAELGVYAESDSGGAFVFFPLADAAEVAHYKSIYESDWPDPNTPPNEQRAVVKGNVMAIAERYGQWTPAVREAFRMCAD
jgi:hypothetical protein